MKEAHNNLLKKTAANHKIAHIGERLHSMKCALNIWKTVLKAVHSV